MEEKKWLDLLLYTDRLNVLSKRRAGTMQIKKKYTV